jgi:hypothetical protein
LSEFKERHVATVIQLTMYDTIRNAGLCPMLFFEKLVYPLEYMSRPLFAVPCGKEWFKTIKALMAIFSFFTESF